MPTTKNYPLFVDYKLIVNCKGYRAAVKVKGLVLVEQEGDEWWAYGINPGGISAEGHDFGSAVKAFYERFCSVLYDIADKGGSLKDFRRDVEEFVLGTNDEYLELWEKARQAVRAGAIELKDIPKETKDLGAVVAVKKAVEKITPQDNPSKPEVSLAKAA